MNTFQYIYLFIGLTVSPNNDFSEMSSKTGIYAAKAQQYELMGRVGG